MCINHKEISMSEFLSYLVFPCIFSASHRKFLTFSEFFIFDFFSMIIIHYFILFLLFLSKIIASKQHEIHYHIHYLKQYCDIKRSKCNPMTLKLSCINISFQCILLNSSPLNQNPVILMLHNVRIMYRLELISEFMLPFFLLLKSSRLIIILFV